VKLRPVLRFLGRLLLLLALAQLAPLVCSLLYGELWGALSFLASALITALFGLLGFWLGEAGGDLYRREGILMVVGGWVLASLFGALPYLFSATLTHPVDAFFEAASGFTTTGATVLVDIEAVARGVLFWRSFTQWLGGMGIIVLFVALLPELGPGARFLYKLEVPGPTAETLSPRIRDTAAILWRIYLGFTLAETLLLLLSGLNLYDALTHTFSTLSTGGFSPHGESIAAFGSPLVSLIIILFMVLAGGNFSLYYGVLRGRGWNLLKDPEFRIYLALLAFGTTIVAWDLLRSGTYARAGRAGLEALFQVVSIMSTTGFATADFDTWPSLSRVLLVVLMFVGGSAGSTAGSMKVMRMVIGLKSTLREVRLIFSPNAVISVIIGGKQVPEPVVRSVAGFFILFLTSWGLGAWLLTLGGAEPVTAATASIATLGNVGPGLEAVGPVQNYAFFSPEHKLLMVLLMWLGRLEVYSIAALFTLRFWRS
jgi:trk system potassium uptake protein TrkH